MPWYSRLCRTRTYKVRTWHNYFEIQQLFIPGSMELPRYTMTPPGPPREALVRQNLYQVCRKRYHFQFFGGSGEEGARKCRLQACKEAGLRRVPQLFWRRQLWCCCKCGSCCSLFEASLVDGQTELTGRQADRGRQVDRCLDRHKTGRQTNRQAGRQTDKETGRQSVKQSNNRTGTRSLSLTIWTA